MPGSSLTTPCPELSVILNRLAAELAKLKTGAGALEDSISHLVLVSQTDAALKHAGSIQFFDRFCQTLDTLTHFTHELAVQVPANISVDVEPAVRNLPLSDISDRLMNGDRARYVDQEQEGDLQLF